MDDQHLLCIGTSEMKTCSDKQSIEQSSVLETIVIGSNIGTNQ